MSAKRLTLSAFFMALVVILSSSLLSIPVPGGHFYFNGIIIFLVGLIFPPMDAVIIAGVGSFIGDFHFLSSSYVGNTSNTQPSSSCYLTCCRWAIRKIE